MDINNKPTKKPELVTQLESIFTIDGKGRPEKCKSFIHLLKTVPTEELVKGIEEMSQRKFV